MKIQPYIIKKLSEKIGQDVTTAAGAALLQLDIELKIGESLGLNTVKRLTGVLPCVNKPRRSTLNIIANYMGYPDWQVMDQAVRPQGSRFGFLSPFVDMAQFGTGALVEIGWRPKRKILIHHMGNGLYEVVKSENCKLEVGDLLTLARLAIGFPFVAEQVIRNGDSLGCYQATEGSGIVRFNTLNIAKVPMDIVYVQKHITYIDRSNLYAGRKTQKSKDDLLMLD